METRYDDMLIALSERQTFGSSDVFASSTTCGSCFTSGAAYLLELLEE